jgi:hypothetical protein
MLAAAAAEWAQAKSSCSSYTYNRERSSVFGACGTTTLSVANDSVSSRAYVGDRTTGIGITWFACATTAG